MSLLRFKDLYEQVISTTLKKEFNYSNIHQIPKIKKIVINMGVGEATSDTKTIDNAVKDLMLISGQKPIVISAKKSISTFKLREGMKIGCKVTLRGDRMFDFMERLIRIACPRIREFKGFNSKSFDGRGNFTIGIKEQVIFPEINYDKIDTIRGMDITFVTNAKTNQEARLLLTEFEFPFYN